MKTFGWFLLIIEVLGYGLRKQIAPEFVLTSSLALIDVAFILSATALIIAGNFKHK